MRFWLPALLVISAPAWFTFYSAYQDGLEAQQRGDHALAVQAFTRAIALEPRPGIEVKTYGLNFLPTYYPYLHLAESCLARGDAAGAQHALAQSDRYGVEPAAERAALALRIQKHAAPMPTPETTPRPATAPPAVPKASPPVHRPPEAMGSPSPALAQPPPMEASLAPPARRASESIPPPAKPAPSPTEPRPMVVPPGPNALPTPLPLPTAPPIPPPRQSWPWILGGVAAASALGSGLLARRRSHRRRWVPPPGADPNLQRDFGPYRALRLLGEGGSASAYLGVHRTTGREVAIKVPYRHLSQDPQFQARFLREASLGARLHHPHIVRILTPEPKEGDLWLAMAFVEGITLEAYLRREGPLPVPQAVHLALDIAEAIAHAHANSVVHRDLKPANIMLNVAGAMVMDFGIARVLDAAKTTSTMFIGTPAYAAPECLANPQVGPPADRYALGLILFEMLTGQQPFSGATAFQIIETHRTQPLPDLSAIRREIPAPLVRLVERLCLKDPAERPEDGEVLACLGALDTSPSWPPPSGVLQG